MPSYKCILYTFVCIYLIAFILIAAGLSQFPVKPPYITNGSTQNKTNDEIDAQYRSDVLHSAAFISIIIGIFILCISIPINYYYMYELSLENSPLIVPMQTDVSAQTDNVRVHVSNLKQPSERRVRIMV
jgi:hypothetical protein